MPATCTQCGIETSDYVIKFFSSGSVTTCHRCEHPVHSSPCSLPYSDLILEHVHDEFGQPVRVTSRRQLHEAEKRYGFRSLVGHTDEAHFSNPPRRDSTQIADHVKWLDPVGKQMWKDMQAGTFKEGSLI